MPNNYIKPEKISIKNHPELNEAWIQQLIADDPGIIGLGDLVLRDKERMQPRAGRLDLLLQEPDTQRRFEVEVQLGSTDESHIIRTIEYWDIERKRYPQYEHCAVIIAEDITSRFLNVISLFNGTIPLIAIQVNALKVGDNTTLVFTTVMDEMVRGVVDEDEDAESIQTDRAYWENRATKDTVKLADKILELANTFDDSLKLKYNKLYIGIEKNGVAFNFIAFKPRKKKMNLSIKLPRTDEIDSKIDEAGIDTLEYNRRSGTYRIQFGKDDLETKDDVLLELIKQSYDRRVNS